MKLAQSGRHQSASRVVPCWIPSGGNFFAEFILLFLVKVVIANIVSFVYSRKNSNVFKWRNPLWLWSAGQTLQNVQHRVSVGPEKNWLPSKLKKRERLWVKRAESGSSCFRILYVKLWKTRMHSSRMRTAAAVDTTRCQCRGGLHPRGVSIQRAGLHPRVSVYPPVDRQTLVKTLPSLAEKSVNIRAILRYNGKIPMYLGSP